MINFGTNGKQKRISDQNLKNCIDNFENSYPLLFRKWGYESTDLWDDVLGWKKVNWLWQINRLRYTLSFLQQGHPLDEKPWFLSKCQKGKGIGGPGSSQKWISNSYTVKQCIAAVRSNYPTANGFTVTYPCHKCRCWAAFGMTRWNRNDWNIKNLQACQFGDRKGKHISAIMCIMRPMCNHCATNLIS